MNCIMSFDLIFFFVIVVFKNVDEFDEWLDVDDEMEMIDLKNLSIVFKVWYD